MVATRGKWSRGQVKEIKGVRYMVREYLARGGEQTLRDTDDVL